MAVEQLIDEKEREGAPVRAILGSLRDKEPAAYSDAVSEEEGLRASELTRFRAMEEHISNPGAPEMARRLLRGESLDEGSESPPG